MKTSTTGVNLIKSFEGFRSAAYRDSGKGVVTIGYGHTGGVRMGTHITEAEAEEYLRTDLERAESAVNAYMNTYRWSQNEFDALVSFTFNCGRGNLDLLTSKGKRSKTEIADALPRYRKAGGKVLTGLVKRREAEKALFLSDNIIAHAEPTESSYQDIALNCVKGYYGNGEARRKKVAAMGYNYARVRKLVNRYLKRGHF